MKLNRDIFNKRWLGFTLSLCAAVLFYVVIMHLNVFARAITSVFGFFLPVVIAFCIAYVLSPLVAYTHKTLFFAVKSESAGRRLSLALLILLLLLGLAVLTGSLVPQIGDSVTSFIGNIDAYAQRLQAMVESLNIPSGESEEAITELVSGGSGLLKRATDWISDNLGNILRASAGFGSNTFNWIVGFILSVYFLADEKHLASSARELLSYVLPEAVYSQTVSMWKRFRKLFVRYLQCELIDALIVGAANYVFMKIASMPYALLISVVVGVTNLVPTFGPVAGAGIGALILLLADPVLVLWFLLFTLILQTVDGYWIKPKLFGNVLNVSAILILVTIIVGGRMLGVIGILLAIPGAAVMEYLWREAFLPWLRKKKQAPER